VATHKVTGDHVIPLQQDNRPSGFTPEQIKELSAKLDASCVKKTPKDMDYVEGWHVIAEANRIFGFDGWSRELRSLDLVGEPYQDAKSNWRVGYKATVRVIVHAGDRVIFKDGTGYGSGIVKDPNDAHEKAMKESETDAIKRALKDFGNPFGLALYDKAKEQVLTAAEKAEAAEAEAAAEFAADLENKMATAVPLIADLVALDGLFAQCKADILEVGRTDVGKRNAVIALFTKRKNELLALQPKPELKVVDAEVSGETPVEPTSHPAPALAHEDTPSAVVPTPANAPAVAAAVEDFDLPAKLVINPKSFPNPEAPSVPNWPEWGKACIKAVKSIDTELVLDKWVARHDKTLDFIDKLTVVGKFANGDDMTGSALADMIALWVRRQYAKINGATLAMRWADGKETNFHADVEDWADGLESMAKSPATFHNVFANREQVEALIRAHDGAPVASRLQATLDKADALEAARRAEREAA